MEIYKADVIIVGGGGAGLRAAIAVAEANPALKIALVSKVYPMRSHTVAAEGGSAGVKKASTTTSTIRSMVATGCANRTSSSTSSPVAPKSSPSSSIGAARGAEPRTDTSMYVPLAE